MFGIALPEVKADGPRAVARDRPIVGLADRADPDVQDAAVGGEIGEQLTVGRNLRRGALRIVEQHAPGNNRGTLGDDDAAEQAQRENGKDQRARPHLQLHGRTAGKHAREYQRWQCCCGGAS